MKITKNSDRLPLNSQSIDTVSEKTEEFLKTLGTEKKNILRLRLSIEEILLRWRERFGEETSFLFCTGKKLSRPYITLELEGEKYDPLEETENFGSYCTGILTNMGLSPSFSYQHGANCVTVRLKKKTVNPIILLLCVMLLAVGIGALGFLLPDIFRQTASEIILAPLSNAFFGILSTVAGPLIFLSVAWGIYSIGDAKMLERIGKTMMLRFVSVTFTFISVAMLAFMPFLSFDFAERALDASSIRDIVNLILGMLPNNIISPFHEGNTSQIIILAAVFGCIMLVLDSRTKVIASFIEQINGIIQYAMELVSRMIPAFIFIILLNMFWSDSMSSVKTIWKPLVFQVAVVSTLTAVNVIILCIFKKERPSNFLKKAFPTFFISLSTASSAAAFGTSISCCENELGVSPKITHFGLPLSMAMFKPSTGVSFMASVLYFSSIYEVKVSIVWFITALIVTTVIVMSIPPIPGGGIACYTILFAQLGIPAETLAVVVIIELFGDFICTGFDSINRQLEMIRAADKHGLLDAEVLRK